MKDKEFLIKKCFYGCHEGRGCLKLNTMQMCMLEIYVLLHLCVYSWLSLMTTLVYSFIESTT